MRIRQSRGTIVIPRMRRILSMTMWQEEEKRKVSLIDEVTGNLRARKFIWVKLPDDLEYYI